MSCCSACTDSCNSGRMTSQAEVGQRAAPGCLLGARPHYPCLTPECPGSCGRRDASSPRIDPHMAPTAGSARKGEPDFGRVPRVEAAVLHPNDLSPRRAPRKHENARSALEAGRKAVAVRRLTDTALQGAFGATNFKGEKRAWKGVQRQGNKSIRGKYHSPPAI